MDGERENGAGRAGEEGGMRRRKNLYVQLKIILCQTKSKVPTNSNFFKRRNY